MVSSEMGHASHMSRTPTPRQRAREEMEQRILATAPAHMAEVGPAQLSLRAVARELGVASSAVYRYVASRDDLITRLILEIYGELADAAEAACADAGADLATQWSRWAHSMRDWARAHPYDWALVYGTPIPGYAARPTPSSRPCACSHPCCASWGTCRAGSTARRPPPPSPRLATSPVTWARPPRSAPRRPCGHRGLGCDRGLHQP